MQSTNAMIDVAAKHLFALENPVPPTVFLVVILASAIAMVSIGYACGLSGTRLRAGRSYTIPIRKAPVDSGPVIVPARRLPPDLSARALATD